MDIKQKILLQRKLSRALETMNVPEFRRTDLRWLLRNIGIKNADDKKLPAVIMILKTLIRKR